MQNKYEILYRKTSQKIKKKLPHFSVFLILGYGLGAAIGLFSSSVNPNIATPGMPEKQQTAREIFREMRATTHSYAKNFALIGAVFSAVECAIETVSRILN